MDLYDLLSRLMLHAWPPVAEPVFWGALLLVIGALAGEAIVHTTRWPRVVGYALAGTLAATVGYGVEVPLAGTPRLLVDVALALLLFEVGTRVRLAWLRFNPGLLISSLAEAALCAVAVAWVLQALGLDPWAAATCGVLAMPGSAAIAGHVTHEMQAQGQVTDRSTLLTALNTLYGVLALVVLLAMRHAEAGSRGADALAALGFSFFGALLIAAVLARAVATLAHRIDLRDESAVLLLLGLVTLATASARMFGVSTVLVPLIAGLMLRQSTPRPWVWPRHFGTAGGVLVLLLFVIVGSAWSPAVLAAGGVAALALVTVRAMAKTAAVVALAPLAGASVRQGIALGVALTPMSATTLVLLADVQLRAPDLAAAVAPVVLSALAVLQLAGPIALSSALSMAGELPPRRAPAPIPQPVPAPIAPTVARRAAS